MKQSYTSNFLLKFLYKESSLTQTLETEHLIENDSTVKEEYSRLKKAYKMLPKVMFYPSDSVMTKILNYSSSQKELNASF